MSHKIRWTATKIAQRLQLAQSKVHRQSTPLPPFRYQTLPADTTPPSFASDHDDSAWLTIEPNSYWGNWRTNFVLRTTFTVPTDWLSNAPIALHLPIGEAGDFSHPEALIYINGRSHAACDRHHQEIILPAQFCDGQTHQLTLHGWTGLQGWFDHNEATKLLMHPCTVVQIDQPTRDFVATARVALGVANILDDHQPAKDRLYNALDDAFKQLNTREPLGAAFYDSVPAAHAALREGIAAAGAPLDVDLIAAGHAHIDVAWLWTVAQTRHKSHRTFHTVLRLMEQFPDYQFTQSQPQLYHYLAQDDPALLNAIKEKVAAGRWEPIGGMWIEADCNLSGSEALARQFLLGRSYFRELFGEGAESAVMWLPDVFGYAWNLPQLIKQAGLDYFFTIKISWSQYNRLPYDSFWWQGLDGTKVLTHFSTTQDDWSYNSTQTRRPTTYNANVSPLQVHSTWQNLQQKEAQRTLLTAFGYGDGGGGPTREMLENIREMANFPATPQIQHGKALDFFQRLEAESGDQLPTWNGELYLEYHRGTYTTQAATKRGNRKSEFLLHDAEFVAAWAALLTDYAYPHEQLTQAWRLLCLNQFHDILPGSSIAEVYVDALADYEKIAVIGSDIREAAIKAIAATLPAETAVLALNPTPFPSDPIALLPDTLPNNQSPHPLTTNQPYQTQPVADGTLIELPPVPAHGLLPLALADSQTSDGKTDLSIEKTEATLTLQSGQIRAVFNLSGDLIELYDKNAQRQVLPAGARANLFQAFEDRPMDWDAWDIDIYYDDRQWEAEPAHQIDLIETGPLRIGAEIRRQLGQSEIVQRVFLTKNGRRLDFDTQIEWREKHVLLKVAFPVDVLSPVATYDVQWGNVERPTHRNTSWDWARFETCAHKWVDLSEGNYGVSLLNDCKYGHDVRDNVLRLTLLRSPTHPDRHADQGHHRFIYSLLPHAGDWRTATPQAAYALNNPLILRCVTPQSTNQLAPNQLISANNPNVIIETIKQAEDGSGLIVRLYENGRSRGQVTLQTSFPLQAAYDCNLLEESQAQLEAQANSVTFPITPYQIKTIRLIPATAT